MSVSYEPLIEAEEGNQTAMPKCSLFISLFLEGKGISIFESLILFLFYTQFCVQVKFKNEIFVERIVKIWLLNTEFLFVKTWKENP